MAFTGPEFLRGAIFTVLSFTVGFPLSTLIPGMTVMWQGGSSSQDGSLVLYLLLFTGYSGLVATAFCALIGAPIAFLIGRLLRQQPNRWLHRFCFLLLGLVSGAAGPYLVFLPFSPGISDLPGTLIPLTAVLTALAVWAGWEFACARAIRGDAMPRTPRLTPDEDAEDRAVENELRRASRADAPLSRSGSDDFVPRGHVDK